MPYASAAAQLAYNRRYLRKNRVRIRNYRRKWAKKHKEKIARYLKEWLKDKPNYVNESLKRSYRKHKLECLTRSKTNKAIKKGQLKRSKTCQKCGRKCFTQAHHLDYLKPMDVVWLCIDCHREEHKEDYGR